MFFYKQAQGKQMAGIKSYTTIFTTHSRAMKSSTRGQTPPKSQNTFIFIFNNKVLILSYWGHFSKDKNVLHPSSLTCTLTSMPPSPLFSSVFSSLTFFLYQFLISPCTTGLQAVRTAWSTTGGCRHITSSGTVIIWLFYCWMCCWRSAWGESNIFFATKFLGGDSTPASYSEHWFPKLPAVLERRTKAYRDFQTQS